MEIKNLNYHEDRWLEGNWSKQDLIDFEDDIISHWENGEISGPIHLSNGNEDELIEIFKKISINDYVFSTWRSHYHALLHGVDPSVLKQKILDGKSITIVDKETNFYSSAIVTGTLPIALGVAKSIKMSENKDDQKVWVFLGDMAFESGIFYEVHKYARNYDLPLYFVVEDNGVSTNTPTLDTWNGIQREIPEDVIYYKYKSKFPHYGTGKWVVF
jgi:TPP-dependent pyruvate/acetoin dehydrogenase alpha subunit